MAIANQSIEPTGGSRFRLSAFVSQGRLPPAAHAQRYVIDGIEGGYFPTHQMVVRLEPSLERK